MDFATIGGFVVGITVTLWLVLYDGDPMGFVNKHAAVVIFGGVIAATLVRFPFSVMWEGLSAGVKYSFFTRSIKSRDLIEEITNVAEVARKSGPNALEKLEVEDPFLAKGIRYIADGYDVEFIRKSMERDRDIFLTELNEGSKVYRSMGDVAPACGMIGTLIGMVQMFSNMSDPSKLGPYMAVALLATLYGAVLANLWWLPVADKMHVRLVEEETNRDLVIDGVLMIRESKSPQVVREMLTSYLPEHHRHDDAELATA